MDYAGSDLKFRIKSTVEGFNPSRDDFVIAVKNRWGKVLYEVKKSQCFTDSQQNWYFTLENVQAGVLFACFECRYGDADYDSLLRTFTDIQMLVAVSTGNCVCYANENAALGHKITYEQVCAVNMDDGTYLVGSDGTLVTTSDGSRVTFNDENMRKVQLDTLTGDEFKQLIEGRNADGNIDTVPEVMDALSGFGDDVKLEEASESDVRGIVTGYGDN